MEKEHMAKVLSEVTNTAKKLADWETEAVVEALAKTVAKATGSLPVAVSEAFAKLEREKRVVFAACTSFPRSRVSSICTELWSHVVKAVSAMAAAVVDKVRRCRLTLSNPC